MQKDCPDSEVGFGQLFFSCFAGDSSSWESHSSSASVGIGCLEMKIFILGSLDLHLLFLDCLGKVGETLQVSPLDGDFLELEVGLGSKMFSLDCLGSAKFLQLLVEFVRVFSG